jgi:hypothetical protein
MSPTIPFYLPLPFKPTISGLVGSESSMRSVAERAPVAVGWKTTAIVQLVLAANVAPQLLVWEKSPGFVPVIVMPEMDSVPGPLLLMVAFLAPLDVPTL